MELTRADDSSLEYVGFCINLASRLQNYSPSLGFIGSARPGISAETLEAISHKKVVATAIKGFPKEIVFVDEDEFKALPSEEVENRFEVIVPHASPYWTQSDPDKK